jgi:hypothetical protein
MDNSAASGRGILNKVLFKKLRQALGNKTHWWDLALQNKPDYYKQLVFLVLNPTKQ